MPDAFETVIVKTTLAPTLGAGLSTVFVSERSTIAIGVVAWLASSSSPWPAPLPGVESGSAWPAAWISAVLRYDPEVLTIAVMWREVDAPAARLPTVQAPVVSS